jgi:hypothetical protein
MLHRAPNANRISDVLLSLIKKIKFEADNSLRSNNFTDIRSYYLLNHLIKVVASFDKLCKKANKNHRSTFSMNTDENIVQILLTLLQKNDNSLNAYDDTFYQANILKALLKCTSIGYFKKIIKEVVRFLNIEFYTKYEYKHLILVIFKYFTKYVNSNLEIMGHSLRDTRSSIYKSKIVQTDPDLYNAFYYIKELVIRLKGDITFSRIIFKQKLNIKLKIQRHKPWDVLIWGMKYVEKVRQLSNCYVVHTLNQEFYYFIKKHKQSFQEMQMPLSLNNNKLMADLLWENVNNSYSTLDMYWKHYAMKVYYTIYGDYTPICMCDATLQTLSFSLDPKWLNFKFELNFERSISNEKKLFTLNYLCLQKRKKNANLGTKNFFTQPIFFTLHKNRLRRRAQVRKRDDS